MERIGLVIGLALVGFACADSVGQMIEDAGQMIEDAGVSMQDGSVPDAGAQAQQSKNVVCDRTMTFTVNGSTDVTFERKYALVDVGGKSFPDVWVRTVYNSGEGGSPLNCIDGYTCSGGPGGKAVTYADVWEYREGMAAIFCNGNEESITIYY